MTFDPMDDQRRREAEQRVRDAEQRERDRIQRETERGRDRAEREREREHRREERRAFVEEFGGEVGDARGADVVIEASGTEQAWADAVALVRPGGTVVMFGGLPRDAHPPIDAYRLHYEELTVRGSFHHTPATVRAALVFLASGAYAWERLVSHSVALEGLPALLADPPRELLKAAVIP
jgi:threonine dehydrogenase-like Zn-dependent dehydrogenase